MYLVCLFEAWQLILAILRLERIDTERSSQLLPLARGSISTGSSAQPFSGHTRPADKEVVNERAKAHPG
jgi:hypothetical protein